MTTAQFRAIERHGLQLLAIFPHAAERDPVELCKKLRRLEARASRIALQLCNGPEFDGGYEEVDRLCMVILAKVDKLLGNSPTLARHGRVPIFINRDPRGHQLKIRSEWMSAHRGALTTDWGDYGIIAPEIK